MQPSQFDAIEKFLNVPEIKQDIYKGVPLEIIYAKATAKFDISAMMLTEFFEKSRNIRPIDFFDSYILPNAYAYHKFDQRTLDIPDNIQVIGTDAFTLSNLEHILGGNNLKVINERAFSYCSRLQWVELGYSQLVKIEDKAFFNCALSEVILPATIESISHTAFLGNKGLESIQFLMSEDEFNAKPQLRASLERMKNILEIKLLNDIIIYL